MGSRERDCSTVGAFNESHVAIAQISFGLSCSFILADYAYIVVGCHHVLATDVLGIQLEGRGGQGFDPHERLVSSEEVSQIRYFELECCVQEVKVDMRVVLLVHISAPDLILLFFYC